MRTSFKAVFDSHKPPPSNAPCRMACRRVPPLQNSITMSVISSGGGWAPPVPLPLPPEPLPLPLLLRVEAAPRPASRSSWIVYTGCQYALAAAAAPCWLPLLQQTLGAGCRRPAAGGGASTRCLASSRARNRRRPRGAHPGPVESASGSGGIVPGPVASTCRTRDVKWL